MPINHTHIADWLARNGDYRAGVAMLRQATPGDHTLLAVLGLPESPFLRAKLQDALRKVLNAGIAETVASIPAPVNQQHNDIRDRAEQRLQSSGDHGDVPEASLPQQLVSVRREIRDQHRRLVHLRGSLKFLPAGFELREVAKEIVQLRRRIKLGWIQIETWRATGTVPSNSSKEPDPETVDGLKLELARLRVYLNPERLAQRKTAKDRVEAMQARRNYVQQRLHELAQA